MYAYGRYTVVLERLYNLEDGQAHYDERSRIHIHRYIDLSLKKSLLYVVSYVTLLQKLQKRPSYTYKW